MVIFALAGINLIFAVRGLSLATPSFNSLDSNNSLINNSIGDIRVLEGAVLAKSSFDEEPVASGQSQEPKEFVSVTVTGYSSAIDETNDTLFITASGSFVRPGVAASNFLPFDTKFRLPSLFGDKVFVVEDRMNHRYDGKKWVDIWFEGKEQAKNFGKQTAQMEIL